jgi:hypothetical protein
VRTYYGNEPVRCEYSIAALFQEPTHRVVLSVFICILLFYGQYASIVLYEELGSHQCQQIASRQTSTSLEYLLDTHIIVLWNYTVDDHGVIKTVPGQVFYREEGGQAVRNEVRIRVDILGDIDSDSVTMVIRYNANTSAGYIANYSIRVSYSLNSGQCVIENGTFTGRNGVLHLFLDRVSEGPFVISGLADLNASARLVDDDYTDSVLEASQACSQYTCQFLHIVDGNVTHSRDYDNDAHVLVRAGGGVSDFVLLGLGNISYAVGTLTLVGTNLDLGAPVSSPDTAVPAILGIGVFGTFGFMYVILYRAQRSPKTHGKSRKKRGPPLSRQFIQVWGAEVMRS